MLYIVITKTHMSIFKISLKANFNIFLSILLKLRINDIYIYTEGLLWWYKNTVK